MKNTLTIIDYGLGNLASVANALQKLAIPFEIARSVDMIQNATALILPGVGAAGQGMENLQTKKIDQLLIKKAQNGTPLLGICLGMQLLLSSSEEGNVNCLGIITGKVKKFKTKLKVPQIGWNQVQIQKGKYFNNIPNNRYFYFVNSYYCEPDDQSVIAGVTNYGNDFCSMLQKENILGVQFHPEKSGDGGLQLLKNFYTNSLSW